jgi:hypothetical protein
MGKAVTRRLNAAFAKVQLAVVVEIGLLNPLGAALGTRRESEMELARRVVERVPEGSLLIADRYYGNKAFIAQLRAAAPGGLRAFLLRVKSNLTRRGSSKCSPTAALWWRSNVAKRKSPCARCAPGWAGPGARSLKCASGPGQSHLNFQ